MSYTAIVFQMKTLHGMERDQSIAVVAHLLRLAISHEGEPMYISVIDFQW